jgi:hypothetical protein
MLEDLDKNTQTDSKSAFKASSPDLSKATNQDSTISFQLCRSRGMEADRVSTLLANWINGGDKLSCLHSSNAWWKWQSVSWE